MNRATKIVATLGPASSTEQVIETMARAGANLFRLNFSHGGHDEQAARIEAIRAVEDKIGRPIGILADLQGPKYRIGKLQAEITLAAGANVCFYLPGHKPSELNDAASFIPLPHAEIFKSLEPKSTILMDDGKLKFMAMKVSAHYVLACLENAGTLSSHKGVNLSLIHI